MSATRGWTPTDGFPVHRARFKGGRVHHRAKDADGYWLETACGKSGLAATGYPNRPPTACPTCYPGAATTSKESKR